MFGTNSQELLLGSISTLPYCAHFQDQKVCVLQSTDLFLCVSFAASAVWRKGHKMKKTKQKQQSIDYSYHPLGDELGGTPATIKIGENGVELEHMILIQNLEHEESLQERYTQDNIDYGIENQKARQFRGDEGMEGDPIEALGSNSTNPDVFLFEEEVTNPQVEQLLKLMENLTPNQINLIYDHYGQWKYLADIAKEEGCKPQAISNRKNKIIKRLEKLFANSDK